MDDIKTVGRMRSPGGERKALREKGCRDRVEEAGRNAG